MQKDRLFGWALSAVLLVGIGAAVVECSNGPTCGNGVKEEGEQCDNGAENGKPDNNCSASCTLTSIARASIQVSVSRLDVQVDAYPNFPAPTCMDLGIASMHVQLDGPTAKDEMIPCSTTQVLYDPVQPGTYQATITLLDANMQPVSKPRMSMMTDVQIASSATNINVAFSTDDYLKSYRGNFDFRTFWGQKGNSCTAASPAVVNSTVKMTPAGGGAPLAVATTGGHKLDGTSSTCFVPTGMKDYEEAAMLPWGKYEMVVTGQVAGGMTAYCKKYEVFVGVGVATPTYDLVVDTVDTSDGGAACP